MAPKTSPKIAPQAPSESASKKLALAPEPENRQTPHEVIALKVHDQIKQFGRHFNDLPEANKYVHNEKRFPNVKMSLQDVNDHSHVALWPSMGKHMVDFADNVNLGKATVSDLYRCYKHTPHCPPALLLKYIVHRVNNLAQYENPKTASDLDTQFKTLHRKGGAAEKNGHVAIADLHQLVKNNGPKLIQALLDHKAKLHQMIQRGVGLNVRDINGEKHVALTRGLGAELMNAEHALSSWCDLPDSNFGQYNHHAWVPLKDIWFSYDMANGQASGTMGPEHEFLVAHSGPKYQATQGDVWSNRLKKGDSEGIQGYEGYLDPELETPESFDDTQDHQLAKRLEQAGNRNTNVTQAILEHKNAGPMTYSAILRQGQIPFWAYAKKVVPRDKVLEHWGTQPALDEYPYMSANPNLTGQDLHWMLDRVSPEDSLRISKSIAKHPNADSSHLAKLWNKYPGDFAYENGDRIKGLGSSHLLDPNTIESMVAGVIPGKHYTSYLARELLKNPHVTPDQADRLFAKLTEMNDYPANTVCEGNYSQKFIDNLVNSDNSIMKRNYFESNPYLTAQTIKLAADKDPEIVPYAANRASEGLLSEELQRALLQAANKSKVSTTVASRLATGMNLAPDVVKTLAFHPDSYIRQQLFSNYTIPLEHLEAAWPADRPLPSMSIPPVDMQRRAEIENNILDHIAYMIHQRRQYQQRKEQEHVIRPFPAGLHKAEDDFFNIQFRDWVAKRSKPDSILHPHAYHWHDGNTEHHFSEDEFGDEQWEKIGHIHADQNHPDGALIHTEDNCLEKADKWKYPKNSPHSKANAVPNGWRTIAEIQKEYKYFRVVPPYSIGDKKRIRDYWNYKPKPQVPLNTMPGENETIKRVCMATTIHGCLMAINGVSSKHMPPAMWGDFHGWHVYGIRSKPKTGFVDNKQVRQHVPDAHLTGEVWSTEPVKFDRLGTIDSYDGRLPTIKEQPLGKAEKIPHPHTDGAIPNQPNYFDQNVQGKAQNYHDFAQHYGNIQHGKRTNLMHYDYRDHEEKIDHLTKKHGYQHYIAGGKYGKPDLASRNYNTGHLMIYDPTPESGGDFGDEAYTRSWRKIHELAHALTYKDVNSIYGEGRRLGKLGYHRTLNEAKRAVHWEWLAAHKQRELGESFGYFVSDETFNKELNVVMHDAVHRAVTGKFTNPDLEGFEPFQNKVPLEQALQMLHYHASAMGLNGLHETFPRPTMSKFDPDLPKALYAIADGLYDALTKKDSLEISTNLLAISQPLISEEVDIAVQQLGHDREGIKALLAAKFLSGSKDEPDMDRYRLALVVHEGDVERAALHAYGITDSPKNLAGLRSILKIGEFSKAEEQPVHIHSAMPCLPDAQDTAEEIARASQSNNIHPIKLDGKHTKGAMAARDPKTGHIWLIKPGSGNQSPAAGVKDSKATQSEREAAFWHVADALGLGKLIPRADLVAIDGRQTAVIRLLSPKFTNLDKKNRKEPGLSVMVLENYRKNGQLWRWATLDWILGNPDRHGQNVMVGEGESIALIDHGSAFAGKNFDPGHDSKSFVPYYLRVFSPVKFTALPPDKRVSAMPTISHHEDAVLKEWIDQIDENIISHILGRYGIDPSPVLERLASLKTAPGPKYLALNKLWAGVGTPEVGEIKKSDVANLPPVDIRSDIDMLNDEKAWMTAMSSPGSTVTHRSGFIGKVIKPAKDPVNGLGQDSMVLVEHPMDGQSVQRWYPALHLSPYKPEGRVLQFKKAEDLNKMAVIDRQGDTHFWNWFGASKVVDPSGKPMTMYRGTRRPGDTGGKLGTESYTTSPDVGSIYAGTPGLDPEYRAGANVFLVHLKMTNPLDLTPHGPQMSFADYLRSMRYGQPGGMTSEEAVKVLNYMAKRHIQDMSMDGDSSFKYKAYRDPDEEWGGDDEDDDGLGNREYKDESGFNHYNTPLQQLRDEFQDNYNDPESQLKTAGRLHADSFAFVDAPRTQPVAERLGHDGIIHHDVFQGAADAGPKLLGKDPAEDELAGVTSDNDELADFDDWDSDPLYTHVTYRPFKPEHQVRSIFHNHTVETPTPTPAGDTKEPVKKAETDLNKMALVYDHPE